MENKNKIAAVVVTYNRLNLLKEVLHAFEKQTVYPSYMIIVDNASSDGTYEYLEKWKNTVLNKFKVYIIKNEENVGGSGGFYIGTQKAIDVGADWIWVSDDDAIPQENVFELANLHIENLENDVSAICTKILVNKKIALSNRNFRKKTLFRYKLIDVPNSYYSKKSFEINCFSYLGVLMNADKLRKVGLINKDYFIWLDDVEHSWRLNKVGKIICFPDMIVDHKINFQDYQKYSWKTYYGYRNDLLMLKEHATLWFYICKEIIIMMKGLLSHDKIFLKICVDAIKDANVGKVGMHSIYRPGWKC